MCMNKKVSVIVPVYNLESYIERCLDSLLMQDYDDLEIILVNDGSTDKSLEIIEKYAQQSESIIVINQKNSGVSSARNAGIEKATGFFIAFVDGDDYVDSDFISTLVEGFENGAELSMVGYRIIKSDGICQETADNTLRKSFSTVDLLDRIYDKKLYLGFSFNKCFLKDIIRTYNIKFDGSVKVLEDLLFCIEYISHIQTGYYHSASKYSYCMRTQSTLNTKKNLRDKTQIIALQKIIDIAEGYPSTLEELTRNRLMNLMIAVYYAGSFFDYYDKSGINDLCDEISKVKGKLTHKHKVMFFLMKKAPYLSYMASRTNSLIWSKR